MNFKERFTYVYDNKVWGDGSGGGSNIDLLGDFVSWLNNFILENKITSMLDYGCGMSGLGEHIKIEKYIGVDVVESVIKYCEEHFENDNRLYYVNSGDYPKVGKLILIKDVFPHWSYEETEKFLNEIIKYYKYIVIVNSCNQTKDYQPYETKPHLHGLGLSYQFEPLKQFNPELIMKLGKNPNDPKEVLLISNI